MKSMFVLFLISLSHMNIVSGHFGITVPAEKQVFDQNLYESVLDSDLCEKQMQHMRQDDLGLLLEFLDAGLRIPTGIFTGNMLHLGNYYQCLGINKPIPDSVIEGKYCLISLSLNEEQTALPTLDEGIPSPFFNLKNLRVDENILKEVKQAHLWAARYENLIGTPSNFSRAADTPGTSTSLNLAVCIPKTCTTRTALNSLFNSSELSSITNVRENFCRLPDDKPWVAGDYVAVSIFSFIGLLVLLSTSYDLYHNVFKQKGTDQKPTSTNKLLLSFSAYTNTRRLVTYTPVPGALECLDGIRSFAMMWVIVGHSFGSQAATGHIGNQIDIFKWMTSWKAIWITAAPISVDTFFMLSGLLMVYTTAGKLTSIKLLKSLHLFYLNRLLRMFPVLAATILLQVSILNRVADGPLWHTVVTETHRCRVYWWSTLLHIQNYLNPAHSCLAHSWYLAVDVQLHIISPIVLVWVLTGKRRLAWSALVGSLIAVLAASTTYNFIKKFPPASTVPTIQDPADYSINYYVNTLCRGSPFFVGLIFGYILHLNRGKKVVISWIPRTLIWICAFTLSTLIIYSNYPIMQMDWDNKVADGLINSFMRPTWAAFVGWIIFACVHGYGGPINWLLSLRMWKVISRLSYAMYLVHYPMMFVVNSMPVTAKFFTVQFAIYQFLADLALAILVAFLVTVMIDSPFSVIIKHFMGGGAKKAEDKQ